MSELLNCPFCNVPREQRMIPVRGTSERIEVNCTPDKCRGAEVLTLAGWSGTIQPWNKKYERYAPTRNS